MKKYLGVAILLLVSGISFVALSGQNNSCSQYSSYEEDRAEVLRVGFGSSDYLTHEDLGMYLGLYEPVEEKHQECFAERFVKENFVQKANETGIYLSSTGTELHNQTTPAGVREKQGENE